MTQNISAIIQAAATVILVGLTAVYVIVLYKQQKATATQEQQRGARVRQAARDALVGELKQLAPMLEAQGHGANYIELPSAAWGATFAYPDIIPAHLQEPLLDIYARVARLNASGALMLAMRSAIGGGASATASGTGLDRHTSSDSLAGDVRSAIAEIAKLPPVT